MNHPSTTAHGCLPVTLVVAPPGGADVHDFPCILCHGPLWNYQGGRVGTVRRWTVNACSNGWQWLRVDTCWFEGAFPTIPNHEPFPIFTNQPWIVDGWWSGLKANHQHKCGISSSIFGVGHHGVTRKPIVLTVGEPLVTTDTTYASTTW